MKKFPNDHEPTRMIRIGTIVTPDEFSGMVAPSSDVPAISSRALLFYAPPPIIAAFGAPGQTLSHRIAVHSAEDGFEQVLVLTIQRDGAVLHGVLPLSDSDVKGYILDCIERQSIQLILALESSSRFAVMSIDSPLGPPNRFDELLRTARPSPGGVQMLVDMTKELLERPLAPPWVLELPVQHLFAVLAGRSVVSTLSRARRSGSKVH